jgi:hypothetical protein
LYFHSRSVAGVLWVILRDKEIHYLCAVRRFNAVKYP